MRLTICHVRDALLLRYTTGQIVLEQKMNTVDYKTAKGWLRDDEREALKLLAKRHAYMHNCLIINIGIEFGASIACLRAGAPAANILAIDLDVSKLVPEVYRECKPLLQEGDSHDAELQTRVKALAKWYAGGVQMVFVDGDHTAEGVEQDAYYCDLVMRGGVAVFHDCYDYDHPELLIPNPVCPGVYDAVAAWARTHLGVWIELPRVGTMRSFRRV